MGAKWATVSTSTYADGSPSDDGTATQANKVKYATIKTDLTDPLDTAIDQIVANLDERFDEATTPISTDYTTIASDHCKILQVSDGDISLLAVASAGAGYRVGVYADISSGFINVLRSSTDTIQPGSVTSIAIPAGRLVWFTVNAGQTGYLSTFQTTDGVTLTASSSATLSFDANTYPSLFDGTYRAVIFEIATLKPATDDTYLIMRIGTGATPTYQTGAGAYGWGGRYQGTTSGVDMGSAVDSFATSIALTPVTAGVGLGTGTGEHLSMRVDAPRLGQAERIMFSWRGSFLNSSAGPTTVAGGGGYGSTTAITGVRFLMSSGNIASGTITARGIR